MQPNEKGTRKDLVLYRIETSKSDIKAAEILLVAKEFRGANNRAYYGIYHAISAVHALDGNAYKRHKDALANFNKNYVKTEIFPRKLGKKIVESEEIRHASDYDDFYQSLYDKLDIIELNFQMYYLLFHNKDQCEPFQGCLHFH